MAKFAFAVALSGLHGVLAATSSQTHAEYERIKAIPASICASRDCDLRCGDGSAGHAQALIVPVTGNFMARRKSAVPWNGP